ncbi:MAG: urease accessory protein UreF, partial [Nitrospira sp. SB0666_bin_27]|nr:urease accessory protein UreF [Nitrospira sp. SB0666_bin_27]
MDTRLLLQGFRYLDTFFPSGGFAFSSGLETAVQEDNVRTAEDLNRYVVDFFRWGLGPCEAV